MPDRDIHLKIDVFPSFNPGLRIWAHALRVHQWVKNSLIMVPLFLSQSFDTVEPAANALLATISFSLCASGIYLLNDLLDLEDDRRHPTKKNRPFAAGKLSIATGITLIPILLLTAVALAICVNLYFVGVLTLYFGMTTLYSLALKKKMLLDVFMLSSFYTVRIFAGTVAIDVSLSLWLFTFSIFIFLSLALIKRYTEISLMLGDSNEDRGKSLGARDYCAGDLPLISSIGSASGIISVLVFLLFVSSPDVQQRYSSPDILWLGGFVILYWICNMWLLTQRGVVNADPVIFAVCDRTSQITLCLISLIVAMAILI